MQHASTQQQQATRGYLLSQQQPQTCARTMHGSKEALRS
jgi:hypothetical protein